VRDRRPRFRFLRRNPGKFFPLTRASLGSLNFPLEFIKLEPTWPL